MIRDRFTKRALAALLGFTLCACTDNADEHPGEDEEEAVSASTSTSASASASHDGVVTIEPEIMERLGLKTAPLVAGAMAPSVEGFGRVLDPALLLPLWGGLDAAEAEIDAAQMDVDRLEEVMRTEQGVARKNLEAARVVLRLAEIKAVNLRRDVATQWGAKLADLEGAARETFANALAMSEIILVRADLALGAAKAEPVSAILAPLDGAATGTATAIWPAPSVDDRLQGRGYFLQMGGNPALRPGARPRVRFSLPGDAKAGVIVPEAAVVHVSGQSWVYVKVEEHDFKRTLVSLTDPVGEGWFDASLHPGDEVIVEGAGALLGLELGAEEIDE